MPGQIDLHSPFGSNIYNLAKDPKYKTFLDVGTWNGEGSTLCLYEAVADREDAYITSIESDKRMCQIASDFWKRVSPPRLRIVHGTLSRYIMGKEIIMKDPLFHVVKNHFDLYYDQDVQNLREAPLLNLDGNFDFVVLDGGEFCGKCDFEVALGLNPKVIALDDINVMKNFYAYNYLLLDRRKWELHSKGNDRNGWAIFTARY